MPLDHAGPGLPGDVSLFGFQAGSLGCKTLIEFDLQSSKARMSRFKRIPDEVTLSIHGRSRPRCD